MKTSDLGDRTTYVGASDFSSLVGVNPYQSSLDLYLRLHDGVERPVSEAAEIGLALEPIICRLYEQRTGRKLIRRNEYVHPEHPWIKVHPDRLIVGEPGLMDAKSSEWSHGWGEPGTDEVPPMVRIQMVVLCGVIEREWAEPVLFRGTRRLEVYRVAADPVMYEALIAEAVRFREEHWLPGVPPPADGSESYRRYLAERFPKDDGTELVATAEQSLLVEELAAAKASAKDAKKREELATQRIKEVMGEATVLLSPAGRVTWKQETRGAYVVAESTFRKLDFRPAKGAEQEEAA